MATISFTHSSKHIILTATGCKHVLITFSRHTVFEGVTGLDWTGIAKRGFLIPGLATGTYIKKTLLETNVAAFFFINKLICCIAS